MSEYLDDFKKRVELGQHIISGGAVEFYDGNEWCDVSTTVFSFNIALYRKKPEPKLIPLDSTDIELGKMVVRKKGGIANLLVIGEEPAGVFVSDEYFRYPYLKDHYERLVDGEWVPCSKEEK